MASRKTLMHLIQNLEPSVRKAFREAIANIGSDVQLLMLEKAIRAGDLQGALRTISMDGSYFRPLDEALRAAHLAGADWAVGEVKRLARKQGIKIVGGFDSRNPRAEKLLREWSSEKVVQITEATRQAVRETLEAGMVRGTAPRRAALDVVGRIGPNGKRTGGVLGLDPTKAQWVQNMNDDLRDLNPRYFKRKLRDKRYDSMVRRAMAEGKPIAPSKIAQVTELYKTRMLKLRGEAVARTELLSSLHAAQDEALQQMVDSGQVNPDAVTMEWDSSSDKFTRETHVLANGQLRTKGEAFDIGGYPMRYPGDRERAPAEEVINCRCHLRIRIDFVTGLKSRLTPEELAATRALM